MNPLQSMQTTQPMQKSRPLHPMHPRGKINKAMNFHEQKVMRKRVLGISPHRKPKLEDLLPEDDQAH
jgi:hypothetical protein